MKQSDVYLSVVECTALTDCYRQTGGRQRGWMNNERAFTLLELIVSMAILSVIVVVILSGFRIGTRSWEAGERRAEKNQRLRVVAAQITEEIRSAFALKVEGMVDDAEKKYNSFVGESDTIKFVTATGGLTSNPIGTQLRAVYYKVSSDGLVVRESYFNFEDFFEDPESVGEEFIINPDVTNISFSYLGVYTEKGEYEDDEPEEVREWIDSWDPIADLIAKAEMDSAENKEKEDKFEYQKLPRAVKITLTLKPEAEDGEEVELPPLVLPIATGHMVEVDTDEG